MELRRPPENGLLPIARERRSETPRSSDLCAEFLGHRPVHRPGAAFHLVTSNVAVRRYGIELDAERARIASASGINTIQGKVFDAIVRPESFSLPYPPLQSTKSLEIEAHS